MAITPEVEKVLAIITKQLAWRSPGGRDCRLVILNREQAVLLCEAIRETDKQLDIQLESFYDNS